MIHSMNSIIYLIASLCFYLILAIKYDLATVVLAMCGHIIILNEINSGTNITIQKFINRTAEAFEEFQKERGNKDDLRGTDEREQD